MDENTVLFKCNHCNKTFGYTYHNNKVYKFDNNGRGV